MSGSNKRMILIMFEKDYQYFPTLKEIKDGLIQAQMRQLDYEKDSWCNETRFKLLKATYTYNWECLFKIADLGDLEKPLTPKILSNPNHKITKHLLYLYSMETFIYADLNRACRKKDKT